MNIHTSFLDSSHLHRSLDLAPVMAALVARKQWDPARAANAERLYRMFLELHRR